MTGADEQLTDRIAAGDPAAFADLYDHYSAGLYGYLLRRTGRVAEAEDLLQEVMLRLVRARARLAEVRNLEAYLYTTARNEWARRRRSAQPLPDAPLEELVAPEPEDATPDGLAAAVAHLAPERAEVIELKLHHDLTFAQIGEVLAISPNTAASRYRQALRDLAGRLEKTDVR